MFGLLFWPLRARDRLVTTGVVNVAAWDFILLRGLACIAPFGVTEFENLEEQSFLLSSGSAK
jgi:hypothetical protein